MRKIHKECFEETFRVIIAVSNQTRTEGDEPRKILLALYIQQMQSC